MWAGGGSPAAVPRERDSLVRVNEHSMYIDRFVKMNLNIFKENGWSAFEKHKNSRLNVLYSVWVYVLRWIISVMSDWLDILPLAVGSKSLWYYPVFINICSSLYSCWNLTNSILYNCNLWGFTLPISHEAVLSHDDWIKRSCAGRNRFMRSQGYG